MRPNTGMEGKRLRAGREMEPFEEAVIDYKDRRGSIERVYELGMPVFTRLGRSAAYSIGVPEEHEEIAQELGILFLTRIINDYDPEVSIFPYLRTFADNLARTSLRKKRDNPNANDIFGDPDEEGSNPVVTLSLLTAGIDGSASTDPEEELIGRIDKEAALKKIGEKLYSGANEKDGSPSMKKRTRHNKAPLPTIPFFVDRAPGPTLKNPTTRSIRVEEAKGKTLFAMRRNTVDESATKLSPDQIELRSIRINLGMTQPAFAEAIGINVPRLSSYEYGRTSGVPRGIMEDARELQRSFSQDRPMVETIYKDRPMNEIVAGWARDLARAMVADGSIPKGTNAVSEELLAASLSVTKTTIRRWMDNDAKPAPQVIIKHNETIKFIVTQRLLKAGKDVRDL